MLGDIKDKRYAVDRAAGDAVDRQNVAENPAVGDGHDRPAEVDIVDVVDRGERGERNGRCVLDVDGGGIEDEAGASFTAMTLITAAATLLVFTPSLTTTSMRRSTVSGLSPSLL